MEDPTGHLKGAAGRVGLTHLALRCKDTTATAKFYQAVCGMSIVHERAGDGMPVYWVSARPLGIDFVLVLLGGGKDGDAPRMDHLGFTVESREYVDRIAAKARELGILQYAPTDSGPPVGYWTMIRDPDGNWVEFSVDQDIAF
ncbi:MAG: VOC family protein [Planctomycetes bacterium]|nr:VOC family protein [Planctomycetota bacterium]